MNGYALEKPTIKTRIRRRLYPPRVPCPEPEKFTSGNILETVTFVNLDWKDRIRALFSGWVKVTTKTATENRTGKTRDTSQAYVVWRPDERVQVLHRNRR